MKTIFTIVVCLGIGFGVAWFVHPVIKQVAETPIMQSTEQSVETQNAFFTFADTFTPQRDIGTPIVLRFDTEYDLMAFQYGSSQESSQFGVYDYANDKLYTGIGAINYIEVQQLVAILGGDKLLIWSSPGVDALPTDRPSLVIKDFNDTTLNTIPLPAGIPDKFHQAYGYDSVQGKLYITVKDTFDHTPETNYETYIFDEETFELIKREVQG